MIREVVAQGRTYRVETDAVLRADALVVAPIPPGIRTIGIGAITSLHPHTAAHVASGAWLVVTGDPDVVCPDLDTTPLQLGVKLVVGAKPATIAITVPAGSSLPFLAPDVAVTGLAVIALAGTVRRLAFPRTPIPGATVTIDGPHDAGTLLGVRTVLAAAHDVGTPVRPRNVTIGAPHSVTDVALSGTSAVTLDALGGLGPGSPLALVDGEVVIVDAVDVAASRVRLTLPLQRTQHVGATVNEATLGLPGAATTLARAVEAGDGVIVTSAPVVAPTIEIDDPVVDRREVRSTGAITDADGRYRLAGVRDVPAAAFTFSAAGFTTLGPHSYPLDPRRDPTLIDAELAV